MLLDSFVGLGDSFDSCLLRDLSGLCILDRLSSFLNGFSGCFLAFLCLLDDGLCLSLDCFLGSAFSFNNLLGYDGLSSNLFGFQESFVSLDNRCFCFGVFRRGFLSLGLSDGGFSLFQELFGCFLSFFDYFSDFLRLGLGLQDGFLSLDNLFGDGLLRFSNDLFTSFFSLLCFLGSFLNSLLCFLSDLLGSSFLSLLSSFFSRFFGLLDSLLSFFGGFLHRFLCGGLLGFDCFLESFFSGFVSIFSVLGMDSLSVC